MQAAVGRLPLRLSGLVVALVGFTLSRATVAASVSRNETLLPFLVTSALPMALSFALVVLGIGLTVSSLPVGYVRTVTGWCLLGTAGMFLTVVVSAFETETLISMGGLFDATAGSFATNALLGGATGGTLIGVYAARNRQSSEQLANQADRLQLLNLLLRDEVLNAITVVSGHADYLDKSDDPSEHVGPISRNADHIEHVIQEVGDLTNDADPTDRVLGPVDVASVLASTAAEVREDHPGAEITVESVPSVMALADDQLGSLLEAVLSNAVEHNPEAAPTATVRATATDRTIEVTVADDGPGMAAAERALLEEGDLSRYDSTTEGFGLWIARLLLDRYSGTATVAVDDGTTVTLSLPRSDVPAAEAIGGETMAVAPRLLGLSTVAGLVAGVGMGATLQAYSSTLPVIGSLYGNAMVSVGWISHLFHSVTFAVVFAAVLGHPLLATVRESVVRTTAAAVGFGAVLWLVAAGIVMPLWLNVVGVQVAIPRLQFVPMVGHLLWGALLGPTYWWLGSSASPFDGE